LKLALGTVQFGLKYGIANNRGLVPQDEVQMIIEYARNKGIYTLDTAIAYGNCEQRLGEAGVDDWEIVTKLPIIPEDCKELDQWVIHTVEKSLKSLKINKLYGLLLHRPQDLFKKNGKQLYQALQHVKHIGLVQKIGVSIYSPPELDVLLDHYNIDLIQAPFNILDSRLIESGWLRNLSEKGTELHVRSIFLQGLLLMKANGRPDKFSRWQSLWEEYDDWLESNNLSALQACLGYAMSFPEINKVIVGVDSLKQLKEILNISGETFPDIPFALSTNDLDLINPARWPHMSV